MTENGQGTNIEVMITNSDVIKLKKFFVTKQELKKTEKTLRSEINTSTERILSAITVVIESFGKEIKRSQLSIEDSSEMLNDHERRIEKLEKQVVISAI